MRDCYPWFGRVVGSTLLRTFHWLALTRIAGAYWHLWRAWFRRFGLLMHLVLTSFPGIRLGPFAVGSVWSGACVVCGCVCSTHAEHMCAAHSIAVWLLRAGGFSFLIT